MTKKRLFSYVGKDIFKTYESYNNFYNEWEKTTANLRRVFEYAKRTNKRIEKRH